MGTIFGYIAIPFGYLMKFCIMISPGHNYLVALIFFTLIIQVLLCLIFGIKQQKNMIKQASLAPRVAAIRKKYAGRDDKATMQKMQEETQALYQENGYSPLSGCLPLLIQLPVIMALYYVIVSPLQYMYMINQETITNMINAFSKAKVVLSEGVITKLAEKATDPQALRLAQYDIISNAQNITPDMVSKVKGGAEAVAEIQKLQPQYTLFGFDFSANPTYMFTSPEFKANWLLILVPVLIVATMILSQILTKKFSYQDPTAEQAQNGCSMKVMMYAMPLLSAWISFSLPAAVGVYWIYRSLAATLQQFVMSKIMPLPKFTEEDYKQAEKEINGTSKKKQKKEIQGKSGSSSGGATRSLHHIDDDDDGVTEIGKTGEEEEDDAPEVSEKAKEQAAKLNGEDIPVLKDDSDKNN